MFSLVRLVALRLLTRVLPVTLTVIVVTFFLIQMAPGSFIEVMTSDMQITDPSVVELMRKTYGMDQPPQVQLLKYLTAVAHLDFGFSYRQNVPVLDAITDHLPATLLLMLTSLAFAVVLGIASGALAALNANTTLDRGLSLLAIGCFSAPSFWVGIMLTVLFSVRLGWLPVGDMRGTIEQDSVLGDAWDVARHLILPAVTLGLFYFASYFRLVRASMLEVAQADFVRTARAKGLGRIRVTFAHILRNALLPLVTLVGLQLGTVLSGSVVIETVFSWPGIGSLLFDGVSTRDYPIVLGVLILGSATVVTANTLVDIVYAKLDPRVRLA